MVKLFSRTSLNISRQLSSLVCFTCKQWLLSNFLITSILICSKKLKRFKLDIFKSGS